MSIVFDHPVWRTGKVIPIKNFSANLEGDWVVWSYNGIVKNKYDAHQPLALIGLRKFSYGSVSEQIVYKNVALTYLGQLRIGTIWNNSICNRAVFFNESPITFDIDFSQGNWKVSSFFKAQKGLGKAPYPFELYPHENRADGNKYLIFPLQNNGKLVIPCLEFFSRCYGRSQEVKRILTTYPWKDGPDSAWERFFAPLDEPEVSDCWKVKLRMRLVASDVIFLAHVKYDKYARHAAKMIYAQISADFDPKSSTPHFITVIPWLQGPGQIQVRGIWFDNGRSFLAHQVLGCSDPSGEQIYRYHEQRKTNQVGLDDIDECELQSVPRQKKLKPPKIMNLTSSDAPDHTGDSIEVLDPGFSVIGIPRHVIDVKDGAYSSEKFQYSVANERGDSIFSSSQPYGDGKNVGRVSIYAELFYESEGWLQDMWDAACYLKASMPERILSVSFYTFQDGEQTELPLKLIKIPDFEEDDNLSSEMLRWLYLDKGQQRGVLVLKINVQIFQSEKSVVKSVYILEVQRRVSLRKSENGFFTRKEDSLRGLVFMLNHERDLDEWLKLFLQQVRYVTGKVGSLSGLCPGKALEFKHSSSSSDQVPGEAAIRNALRKMMVL